MLIVFIVFNVCKKNRVGFIKGQYVCLMDGNRAVKPSQNVCQHKQTTQKIKRFLMAKKNI